MNKSRQRFEKNINGKTMRYCQKYNIWIDREGNYAYREYNNASWNAPLIIYKRADGSKYLNPKSPGEIPLDEAVAICFNPMPNDGKKYILIHKDKNLGNCRADNLEWKEVRKFSPTATERKLDNGLIVKRNGEVIDKKKVLPVVTETGDSDTDRMVAIDPYVRYFRKNRWKREEKVHTRIDDLMAAAEFVGGDKTSMTRPRVLHKDMDYLNFDEENLEWVEENSPEYQVYMKRKKEDMDKLTKKLNWNNPNFPKD